MRWLSKGVEALVEDIGAGKADFDAIVVGSGYGGAVAACRLAQAGFKVCVLERGEEWLPGEFPNDIAHLPGHLRIERGDRPGVIGRREGIFDIRLFGKVTTLVGNALGGGSQINANVALRPDPEVFRDERWPIPIRTRPDPLGPYYTPVEGMLETRPYPRDSTKAIQLERLARPITKHLERNHWRGDTSPCADWYRPPLAITYSDGPNGVGVKQKACTGCGDCVTGCNVGAKNTLTMNYLPEAVRWGAAIYSGVSVIAVQPRRKRRDGFGDDGAAQAVAKGDIRASVYFTYADEDWSRELAENRPLGAIDLDTQPGVFRICPKIVVLAAGTLGSTEILLRSRQLNLLNVSPALGTRFSANGGGLAFGYDQDQTVRAIGRGAEPSKSNYSSGPTIVSTLDCRPGLAPREGLLIQDGIVPGALAAATQELLTTTAVLEQLREWRMRGDGDSRDPLALDDDAFEERTQVYLGIGHDAAAGRMRLKDGRVVVDWPEASEQEGATRFDEYLQAATKSVEALYLTSPFRKPLPDALTDRLAGPPIEGTALVVHPLGGCPMGDGFGGGVVDDLGAVYSGDTPRATYPNLFVWDGSAVPCSLGANPFVTIAALAERACALKCAEPAFAALASVNPPARGDPPRTPQWPAVPRRSTEAPALRLGETFRGRLELPGKGGRQAPAALKLASLIPDLRLFLRDPRHRIVSGLKGSFVCPDLFPDGPLDVTGGSIELLARRPSFALSRIVRAVIAWFRKRGRDEIIRRVREAWRGKQGNLGLWGYIVGLLKLAYHAGEQREMRYEVRLARGDTHWKLRGAKTVKFEHGWNLWESLLDLELELRGPGWRPIAKGRLHMDLVDFADHDFPALASGTDLPTALVAAAGLPLLFLRVMLKTHLWDLRAPDYAPRSRRSPLPGGPRRDSDGVAIPGEPEEPVQRPLLIDGVELGAGIRVPATHYWFCVPESEADGGAASKKEGTPAKADVADRVMLPLVLTRLQPRAESEAGRAPLLLLHGFAQSSRALVLPALDEDPVRHLLRKGFDVWLLDYRTSVALPSSRGQHALDEIAKIDIPCAVEKMRGILAAESGAPPPPILAFGHCMGAATLAMSLLAGKLHDGKRCKLAALMISQVPPFIIGGAFSQARRQLAAFLRDILGVGHIDLAADDAASAWEVVLDRLCATLPRYKRPFGRGIDQGCPHEHERSVPRTDIATCKRVQGIIGPVHVHENFGKAHALMHHGFGWGAMSVFAQIGKFFEYERLVSSEDVNHYVTDRNLAKYMKLPIAFLHGDENQVFHIRSALVSLRQLRRVNPERPGHPRKYRLIRARKYGHYDCLVGDKASRDVYPKLSAFFLEHLPNRREPRHPVPEHSRETSSDLAPAS